MKMKGVCGFRKFRARADANSIYEILEFAPAECDPTATQMIFIYDVTMFLPVFSITYAS